MNEREETMPYTLHTRMPAAQSKAIGAAGIAIALVMSVKAPLKPIAEQVVRSAASVPANIAEGQGRSGRDRFHHWHIAYGSARELEVHLRLLLQAGPVDRPRTEEALARLDEVRAMLWRMIHPR